MRGKSKCILSEHLLLIVCTIRLCSQIAAYGFYESRCRQSWIVVLSDKLSFYHFSISQESLTQKSSVVYINLCVSDIQKNMHFSTKEIYINSRLIDFGFNP